MYYFKKYFISTQTIVFWKIEKNKADLFHIALQYLINY